jgi:T-complex protein 1 subunit zeta
MAQAKAHHDGVSSLIVLIDAILQQAEYHLAQGVHTRQIVAGLEEARAVALQTLASMCIPTSIARSDLRDYVSSSSQTKHPRPVADVIVDAVSHVRDDMSIDLDRIDLMKIKTTQETVRLVKGLVIDQPFRHDMMPKSMQNVRILALSVNLELEPSAINVIMPVSNADQRERMIIAERKFVDNRIRSIIKLKSILGDNLLIVNGRGIDGPSLDMLSRANISALRRVSNLTLKRLIHSCGCKLVNCVDDLSPEVLGFAGKVTEEDHRGTKYVFIDEAQHAKAVTIVIGGLFPTTADLIEISIKSGLRSLKDAIETGKVLPGAGASELCMYRELMRKSANGKSRFGLEAFAEALLSIPRALMKNCGLDACIKIAEMQHASDEGEIVGIDLESGEVIEPTLFGIYDSYSVLRGIVQSAPIVASQLLLVDEIIESGKIKRRNE